MTNGMPRETMLYVDEQTALAIGEFIKAHGISKWMLYVYRAINEQIAASGEPRLDLTKMHELTPGPAGDYSTEYMRASFNEGKTGIFLILFQYDAIQRAAELAKMKPGNFVRDALSKWAAIPKGLALD